MGEALLIKSAAPKHEGAGRARQRNKNFKKLNNAENGSLLTPPLSLAPASAADPSIPSDSVVFWAPFFHKKRSRKNDANKSPELL